MKIYLAVLIFVLAQSSVFAQTVAERLQRAKAAIELGDAASGAADLTEAIKLEPANAELFATRAHAQIRLGNYIASLPDSARAIALSPDFGWAYYLHGIASYWQTNKNFTGALADFTKVIALEPKLAGDAYRYRADIHNQSDKDYWAAIADATEAIRLNPSDGNAYAQRGWAHGELKNHAKARDDYRQAIKLNFATAGVYTTLGFNEYKLGEFDQAVSDTRKALELDPNNADAKNNLPGMIAAAGNKPAVGAAPQAPIDTAAKKTTAAGQPSQPTPLSAKDEDKFLADDSSAKAAFAEYDISSYGVGGKIDYERVYDNAAASIKKKPTARMYELRAEATVELNEDDSDLYELADALKDVDTALAMSDRRRDSRYLLRGDIYRRMKDLPHAVESYSKSIEANPNSYPPYLERGKLYLAKPFENWDKAAADFSTVIDRDPKNTEPYNLRAYAYFRLNKKPEATADFKKVLELNPKDEYAKYNLAMLAQDARVLSPEEYAKHKKVYFV